MSKRVSHILIATPSLIATLFLPCRSGIAGNTEYIAAYFETGARSLQLFPLDGPAETLAFPSDLPPDFFPVAFDSGSTLR